MRANLNRNDDGTYRITSTTKVGGTRPTRDRTIALSDCVCYDRDMNVIRTIARTASPAAKNRSRAPRAPRVTMAQAVDIALMSRMGSIHDNDN